MTQVKLIIYDMGDMSVGIYPCSWEIECPFEKHETDNVTWFREEMINAYKEFCNGKCVAEYNFENTND